MANLANVEVRAPCHVSALFADIVRRFDGFAGRSQMLGRLLKVVDQGRLRPAGVRHASRGRNEMLLFQGQHHRRECLFLVARMEGDLSKEVFAGRSHHEAVENNFRLLAKFFFTATDRLRACTRWLAAAARNRLAIGA